MNSHENKISQQEVLSHKKAGLNCAQAVILNFAKRVSLDENLAIQMTDGFGLGIGNTNGTCGAITGGVCLLSCAFSNKTMADTKANNNARRFSKELISRFEEKNKSSICKELKGIDTGEILRDCSGCIFDAAVIVDDILTREGL